MLQLISTIILVLGLINLLRLAVFMIAADVYDVKNHRNFRTKQRRKWPKISILIPAFNEENSIEKTLRSVIAARYPYKQVVVIDDGSTDGTAKRVRAVQARFPRSNLKLIRQKNAGKGAALNHGIKKSDGQLVMVLDADSTIDRFALKNAVKYFDNKQVKAVASSVRLEENGKWLGLIQRVEYLMSYRMKRSLTTLNIEYIIGGVGSVYRRSILKQVSGYRTNTITEDIDLSMKVVARGNKAYRVVFASDVKTTTQPVLTLSELVSQRYRWKRGRMQSFIRYRKLFMSNNKKYSKLLGWFQLPYAIFGEIYLVLEPLFLAVILFVALTLADASALLMAFLIMSGFLVINFLATEDEKITDKLAFIFLTPVIYVMMPILTYVELTSLIKTLKDWRYLSPNTQIKGHWVHVQRQSV